MKKLPKFLIFEIVSIFAVSGVWFLYSDFKNIYSLDLLIDGILIVYLFILIFSKNMHPRHFWYGFICLCASVFTVLLEMSTSTYILTSLTLGFFFLGIINQIIFNRE